MKPSNLISALFFALFISAPAGAQDDPDKIGTVNVQRLLAEYHKTKQVVEEFKGYEKKILEQDAERKETIKTLAEETRALQTEAEKAALPVARQEELLNQVVAQQRELQALQNDRITWLNRKRAAFAEKQKIDFGKLREEIMAMVKEVGEEREFDFIFDESAASVTNVIVLTYAKDATDLTAVMLERINRDAPEEAGEAEESGE